MENTDGRLEPWIPKVWVKFRQHHRHDHAFVTYRDRRQARHVGIALADVPLCTPPGEEQATIEAAAWHSIWCVDENLFDQRQGCKCLLATDGWIRRHFAPAGNLQTNFSDCCIDRIACRDRTLFVLVQKYRSGSKSFT